MNTLSKLLNEKDVVIADGATATNLFSMGLATNACAENWCTQEPKKVRALHQQFVDAGTDIILTNSFSANKFRLASHGLQTQVHNLASAAASIAREVAESSARDIVVAGSVGPTGIWGETLEAGQAHEVQATFEDQMAALQEGGADIAWIETMYCKEELDAAIAAAINVGLPYVATMTFDADGHTMMGLTSEQAVSQIKRHLTPPLAYGANCGMGPAQLIDALIGIKRGAHEDDIIVAKGNAGLPKMTTDLHLHYEATPSLMANYACLARDVGARIIGGCCGTSAEHLRAMTEALQSRDRRAEPSRSEIEQFLGPMKVVLEERPKRRRRR